MDNSKTKLLNGLLMKLNAKELKFIAKKHGLTVGGNKSDLTERIISEYESQSISYQDKLKKLEKKHSIVTDLNNFVTNVYDNDVRLSKLIKNIMTSSSKVNEIKALLNLNQAAVTNHNVPNVLDEILNVLKNDPTKKEFFFRQYYKKEIEVETLESKYLNLYYHFFIFYREEILKGLKTGLEIEKDWIGLWDPSGENSSFAVGAERVIYALINGRGIGQPNSSPVGSDLFFELEDAYVHIDLKTISTGNIGDFIKDIQVGNNQNSYNGPIIVNGETKIYENGNIPKFYTVNGKKKTSLTYFVTILYDEINFDIIQILLLSMPNGSLHSIYETDILVAGKNNYERGDPRRETHADTIRYNWSKSVHFETLTHEKRIKVIYSNEDRKDDFIEQIPLIYSIYNSQNFK